MMEKKVYSATLNGLILYWVSMEVMGVGIIYSVCNTGTGGLDLDLTQVLLLIIWMGALGLLVATYSLKDVVGSNATMWSHLCVGGVKMVTWLVFLSVLFWVGYFVCLV